MRKLKQYARFSIECTTADKSLVKIYKDFQKKYKKFCIDEDMELYRMSREQAAKLYGLNRTHEMTGPIMEVANALLVLLQLRDVQRAWT